MTTKENVIEQLQSLSDQDLEFLEINRDDIEEIVETIYDKV